MDNDDITNDAGNIQIINVRRDNRVPPFLNASKQISWVDVAPGMREQNE